MKTEYKLIKCYPGFNQLGERHSSENKNFEWQGTKYYDKYPEHWEKVVEKKDYQIIKLSLQRNVKPDIIDVSENGEEYILSLLKCNSNEIHSVKRNSDGIIFTIGDKINRACYKDINVIRGFNLEDDLCLASISDEIDKGYMSGKGVNISAIEHTKNVLFTTEDGVDLFEGDGYWQVTSEFKHYFIENNYYKRRDCDKYFSTEKAAKDWIILNKPCLSINEIYTMMNNHRGNHSFNNSVMSNLLKALVKSKL